MNLDELKDQWNRLEEKVDMSIQLQSDLLHEVVLTGVRRRLYRYSFWPSLDIIFATLIMVMVGSFLAEHWSEPSLTIPAVAIMAGAAGLMIESIVQLVLVWDLDWAGPVANIQAALTKLRVAKIRQFKWIILLSPLVGFSVLIVGLQGLVDTFSPTPVSVVEKIDKPWLIGNYVFGLVFIFVGHWFVKMLGQRFEKRPFWQSILDDLSGTSLRKAQQDLQRWTA